MDLVPLAVINTASTTAILILNHNGKMHLDSCLTSVLPQVRPPDQVYLVDNGSTDDSVEYVQERYPTVKSISFECNLGFAEAYNRAVEMISEEFVVLLNNDVKVEEGWLAALKSGIHIDHVGVCGSKILFYHDRGLVNHRGGKLAPIGGGFDIDFMKRDTPKIDRVRYVGCVSGASMIVSRDVFLRLGGFDSDFFAYFEDADFCWRVWLAGCRVLYMPSSIMYHKLGATTRTILKTERIFLGERNRVQSLIKNLESLNLVVAISVSLGYAVLRIAFLLASGKPRAAVAIIRGNWWALRHIPILVIKRRRVQQTRQLHDGYVHVHDLMASFPEAFREFLRLMRLESELDRLGQPPQSRTFASCSMGLQVQTTNAHLVQSSPEAGNHASCPSACQDGKDSGTTTFT